MTTALMIVRVRDKIAEYDLELPDMTDEGVVQELNRAQDQAAERLMWSSPKVTLTISAGVDEYPFQGGAFSRRMRSVDRVFASGRTLDPYAHSSLDSDFPGWQTLDEGEARGYAITGTNSLLLIPAPLDNGTAYVAGRVLPAPLSTAVPSGVSELPESLHLHLCDLAAGTGHTARATEGQQIARADALVRKALAAFDAYSDVAEGATPGLESRARSSYVPLR